MREEQAKAEVCMHATQSKQYRGICRICTCVSAAIDDDDADD
jgi:hypothetical protein